MVFFLEIRVKKQGRGSGLSGFGFEGGVRGCVGADNNLQIHKGAILVDLSELKYTGSSRCSSSLNLQHQNTTFPSISGVRFQE